jgi:DNA (cytosine-5)-methyltransferase 1
MTAYYNEHDKNAAAWLRELIKAGHIAPGDVDERSIADVTPNDLAGYTQCHFFAGIGGWSYALRLAGWPDDRPVWTGSCPCQPFSAAGKGGGFDDERHLWPDWFWLIAQCRPGVIFGEQVESAVKHGWLDLVQDDLEGIGYAVGAHGLPACSVGAPHIRQRAWIVADAQHSERGPISEYRKDERDGENAGRAQAYREPGACGEVRELADTNGRNPSAERQQPSGEQRLLAEGGGLGGMEHTLRSDGARLRKVGVSLESEQEARRSGDANPWAKLEFIGCADGKARPVEPATERLADGLSDSLGLVRLQSYPDRPHEERLIYAPLIQKGKNRVARLRGYGNAIVPQVAAEVIGAYLDSVLFL